MPKTDEGAALGHASFWDERYSKADETSKPTHEWFRDFASLEPFLQNHLFTTRTAESKPRILHLGSGDSTVPYDLLERGYDNQQCVDFSSVVVDLMKSRHEAKVGVEWAVGDVRDLKDIGTGTIDVAFDKGTLDAMIFGSPWSPPEEVMENSGKYMNAVQRVLKEDGFFLYITYRQPHFVKPILNRNNEWDLEMGILGGGDSFEYYGYTLRKQKSS
ncbi:S-adenosyl-L-methionine-dependent methyltransferase [Pyrenochaeta sp. MPI-SDFR-AT-0127]|nr:S-adenosyl-L-methionine-dependent methyltransferase [Pyrenochaeta sp. MPI-SDFR-AT-0127]